jgi:carbamoyltransferase
MDSKKYILGISMSNHDRSACLLKDQKIICAISEERLDRRKKSPGFLFNCNQPTILPPLSAIKYVLDQGKVTLNDLDLVVIGGSINTKLNDAIKYLPIDKSKIIEPPMPGHHLAHAYTAYHTSGFNESLILVVDEQGSHIGEKFEKLSLFYGKQGRIFELEKIWGSTTDLSLGMLYDIFSGLVGLTESGMPSAGKLMGLSSYGGHNDSWPQLVKLDENLTLSLDSLDVFLENTPMCQDSCRLI